MSNNPLRQYFRRPAIYLKLPSKGVGYPEGSLDKTETDEHPVFPMTAVDELTSKTPDALYNGTAVVEIIKSCVPSIKNPWKVKNVDLDSIFVAIRIASSGSLMEIETECPSCNETSKFDLNLSQLLNGFRSGDYETPRQIGDLTFKFQSLAFEDSNKHNIAQFELRRQYNQLNTDQMTEEQLGNLNTSLLQRINNQTMTLMCDSIEYIKVGDELVTDKAFIEEYLRNCDRRTFDSLKDINIDLKKDSETKPLKMKCMHCQHEYDQDFVLNVTDFFDFDS